MRIAKVLALMTLCAFSVLAYNGRSAIQVAETVESYIGLEVNNSSQVNRHEVIRTKDASFIKVHFEYFNLPEGAYIEVSNSNGSEVYRYGQVERDEFTFDENYGEDGYTSFSAMSISDKVVHIRLVDKSDKSSARATDDYGVHVSWYRQGYSEETINELFGWGSGDNQSTCGQNERYDAVCYETSHPTEFERARSVARLLMGNSLCTSWRVGDNNHMFTNNHCMSTSSAVSGSESWFNYQRTSCGGSNMATATKVSGNSLLATDYDLDYTLYTVNSFASVEGFGNLGLDVRVPTLNEEIYIPQHGSGNPKELAIESDRNSGNVCRIDDAVADGRAANTDTGYFCDTIGGSSGSPVLARASHRVIALHHFGGCTNQGVLISEIWPQVSSFFGGVVPQGSSNGGGNASPNAGFSYAANLLSVSFTDASSDSDGSIVDWAWDFGDGNGSSAQNPSNTYAANGSYNVTLTVTDDQGASSSNTQTITVNDGSLALSANSYKSRGNAYVDLSWSGGSSSTVDIYRNGSLIATTANDGSFTDALGKKVRGSFTYEVCEAGDCSNAVTASF